MTSEALRRPAGGTPIVGAAPDSPAAQAFTAVATRIAAQVSVQNMKTFRVIQTA